MIDPDRNAPRAPTTSGRQRALFPRLAVLAASLLCVATTATAQPGGNGEWSPDRPDPGSQPSFEQDTLDAFVDVVDELQEVRTEYTQRLDETRDVEEARALQQEAQGEMVAVIEASPITLETYNAISQRVAEDPEFAQSILGRTNGR